VNIFIVFYSWTVLRQQLLSEKQHNLTSSTSKTTKSIDWGSGADDWGTSADNWGNGVDDCGNGADDWGNGADDWGEGSFSAKSTADNADINRKGMCNRKELVKSDETFVQKSQTLICNEVPSIVDYNGRPSSASTLDCGQVDDGTLGIQELSLEDSEIMSSTAVHSEDMLVNPSQSILHTILGVGAEVAEILTEMQESDLESFYINVMAEPDCSDSLKREKKLAAEYSKREGVDFNELMENYDR